MNPSNASSGGNIKATYQAKHAFAGQAAQSQLSFSSGARIIAAPNQSGAWWWGNCNGKDGWFPPAYVAMVQQPLQAQPLPSRVARMPSQQQQNMGVGGSINQQQHNNSFGILQQQQQQQKQQQLQQKHQQQRQQQRQPHEPLQQQTAPASMMNPVMNMSGKSGFQVGLEDPFAGLEVSAPRASATDGDPLLKAAASPTSGGTTATTAAAVHPTTTTMASPSAPSTGNLPVATNSLLPNIFCDKPPPTQSMRSSSPVVTSQKKATSSPAMTTVPPAAGERSPPS